MPKNNAELVAAIRRLAEARRIMAAARLNPERLRTTRADYERAKVDLALLRRRFHPEENPC